MKKVLLVTVSILTLSACTYGKVDKKRQELYEINAEDVCKENPELCDVNGKIRTGDIKAAPEKQEYVNNYVYPIYDANGMQQAVPPQIQPQMPSQMQYYPPQMMAQPPQPMQPQSMVPPPQQYYYPQQPMPAQPQIQINPAQIQPNNPYPTNVPANYNAPVQTYYYNPDIPPSDFKEISKGVYSAPYVVKETE